MISRLLREIRSIIRPSGASRLQRSVCYLIDESQYRRLGIDRLAKQIDGLNAG